MSLSRTAKRTGFTLVELLVVISIVTLLAALLVPAVFSSIEKAKVARIGVELANIEKALESYKLKMGEYPPDFAELAEYGTEQAKAFAAIAIINDHLARTYRRRAIDATPGPTPGDWPRDASGEKSLSEESLLALAGLNPSNALAFWLRGFSEDPTQPLFGPGTRQPFYSFDESRLDTANAIPTFRVEGTPGVPHQMTAAYFPQGVLDNRPYIYYRANFNTTLTPLGTPAPIPTANSALAGVMAANNVPPSLSEPYRGYVHATIWAEATNDGDAPSLGYAVPRPYYSYSDTNNDGVIDGTDAVFAGTLTNPSASGMIGLRDDLEAFYPYASPKKFQLITCGMDGMFGQGGDWESGGGFGNVLAGRFATADRKNITNFSGGKALEDLEKE